MTREMNLTDLSHPVLKGKSRAVGVALPGVVGTEIAKLVVISSAPLSLAKKNSARKDPLRHDAIT